MALQCNPNRHRFRLQIQRIVRFFGRMTPVQRENHLRALHETKGAWKECKFDYAPRNSDVFYPLLYGIHIGGNVRWRESGATLNGYTIQNASKVSVWKGDTKLFVAKTRKECEDWLSKRGSFVPTSAINLALDVRFAARLPMLLEVIEWASTAPWGSLYSEELRQELAERLQLGADLESLLLSRPNKSCPSDEEFTERDWRKLLAECSS